MLDRFLIVGTGGSGGRTLRYLRAELRRRLESAGYREGLPAGWGFLHIDVPVSPDVADAGQDPDLDYVGLAQDGISYRQIDDLVTGRSPAVAANVAAWKPDPKDIRVDPTVGAGQMRAVGRMITVAGMAPLVAGLRTALNEVESADPTTLAAASSALGQTGQGRGRLWVVVISSLAGGAGAGMYLDVCDALRTLTETDGSLLVGVLFAPDIFADVEGSSARGIMPNALAAVGEVVAASWDTDAPAPNEFAPLSVPGLLPRQGPTRRGASYTFLVSRTNGKVTLPRQADVYRLAATALGTWMLSRRVQNGFSQSLTGNWETAGLRPDRSGLAPNRVQPLSAIGYASFGIGRDRFGLYAGQRLAGEIAEHLLNGHREDDDVEGDATLLPRLAEAHLDTFLARCELREKGPQHNQVIDFLRGGPLESWKERLLSEVDTILQTVTAGRTHLEKEAAQAALTHTVGTRSQSFADALRTETEARAAQWVSTMPGRLIDATTESLVRIGGRGTVALLEKLERHLVDEVAEELRGDANGFERAVGEPAADVIALSLRGVKGRIQTSGNELKTAVRNAVSRWRNAGEATINRLSADLLIDFTDNFVIPLRKALENGLNELQREFEGTGGQHSPAALWATGVVPDELLPQSYELLLEKPESWPATYDQLISTQTGIEYAETAARAAWVDVVKDAGLVRITRVWSPQPRTLSTPVGPSGARLTVDMSIGALLGASRGWLDGPDNAIHHHLEESLTDWLDTPSGRYTVSDKKRDFLSGIEHMLDAGRPLAEISNSAAQRVHGDGNVQTDFERFLTPLPLAAASPLAADVRRILEDSGFSPQASAAAFDANSKVSSFGLLTVLRGPVSPLVIKSIGEPLAADAHARRNDAGYWLGRRTRPLAQSVPAPPDLRRALVRGWFVARFLGGVDVVDPAGPRVRADSAWLPFHHLLGPVPAKPQYLLGQLLESFPVAIVTATQADELALGPYLRLAEYGMVQEGGGARPTYDRDATTLPTALSEWLSKGQVVDGTHALLPDGGSPACSSEEARVDRLKDTLRELIVSYSRIAATMPDASATEHVRRQWELSSAVLLALDELNSGLQAHQEGIDVNIPLI